MGLVTQAQLSLWNLDRGAISADVLVVIMITKYSAHSRCVLPMIFLQQLGEVVV